MSARATRRMETSVASSIVGALASSILRSRNGIRFTPEHARSLAAKKPVVRIGAGWPLTP